ncbi:hypothetical protein QAD02_004242 [Eretmocerus hayati]|uniref:Uncharacterized protein n=1 Tax=Eretmocerus hayati TaxID=131215 RepID=A0ACC2NPB1_9HYME|nr:hypothetical protein QAD02_004242 [Eretmocerus hayati]
MSSFHGEQVRPYVNNAISITIHNNLRVEQTMCDTLVNLTSASTADERTWHTETYTGNFSSSEVDAINLFNPDLIARVANQLRGDGLIFRPLNSRDYDKGFLQLLGQLTEVGQVTKDQFLNRFHGMRTSGGYYVIVVEDLKIGKVIGSATLVVEQKFIHGCSQRGHLEDVVVNSNYRGKKLGQLVVMAVKQLARSLHCYKLSLECKDRLIPFYENLGFKREPGNANSMNMRFPQDSPAEQSRL